MASVLRRGVNGFHVDKSFQFCFNTVGDFTMAIDVEAIMVGGEVFCHELFITKGLREVDGGSVGVMDIPFEVDA